MLVWILYEDAGQSPGYEAAINELAYHRARSRTRAAGRRGLADHRVHVHVHARRLAHLLGNMLFLWIFGNNIEDLLGRVRFVVFYLLAGLSATAAQTFVTLGYGSPEDGQIANLGASGDRGRARAYVIILPRGRVLTWIMPIFLFEIPALPSGSGSSSSSSRAAT